jgi:hypothetical protein
MFVLSWKVSPICFDGASATSIRLGGKTFTSKLSYNARRTLPFVGLSGLNRSKIQ